jgi:two-component system, cell cycle sensor histidine kinase and response regulator CckA
VPRTLSGGSEQAYVRAILDNVAEGIITFDEAGRVESFNRAAGRIFGCTPSEALARDIRDFVPDPTPQLIGSAGREQTGKRSDGETFPMDVIISEARQGGRKMQIAVVRDIGERKNLERQLHQAQRMESVGLLAGGIAHDFNNILTGIITYAALAKRMLGDDNPIRDELTEIEQQGQRAATLIKQLLAFSRNQRLEARAIQVGAVLANVQKFLGRVIGETIALEMKIEPGLRDVMADAAQLEQVMLNLCVNARDAMPKGGRLVVEAARAELDEAFCRTRLQARPGEYVRITVRDEGQGMTPEVLQRIFEPFFTTKETGKGTGLGLAVVYGIVKQHGGFIDVTSEVGKGTTVSVYLTPAEKPKTIIPQQETVPRGGQETILIAEDELGVRRAAVRILESYGYTVLTAGDGEEAVRVFEAHKKKIDLVILDAVMPRGGGKELFETLSASHPQTRFLFVTGYSTSVLGRNFKRTTRRGHFLQKPFSPEELARRVRAALDEQPKI